MQPIQPEYPLPSVQLAGLLDLEIQRRRIGQGVRDVQLKTTAMQIDVPSYLAVVEPELGPAIELRLCDDGLTPQRQQWIQRLAGQACQRHVAAQGGAFRIAEM